MRSLRSLFGNVRGLLVVGLAIRELLSFWTGHPYDMEVWIRTAYSVAQGQNPYSAFMPPVPGLSFAFLQDRLPGVGYLPLWPVVVGALYWIYSVVPGASRFFLYFLLKQPPVVGDTLLGYGLYRTIHRWSGRADLALHGLKFWLLFPYAIVISAIWGMFDAIVAVLVLFFVLTLSSPRGYAALGLGILLKWFPLIFLPFFVLRETGRRKLGPVIALAVPIGLTAVIFLSMAWDFIGLTAMAEYTSHGGGGGMTYVNLLQAPFLWPTLSRFGAFWLVVGFAWVPAIVVAAFVSSRRFADKGPQSTLQALLFIVSVFFLTRFGINEQYLIYLLPLFYVDVLLWHPERKSLFTLTWVLGFAFLLADNDLLLRFFGPAFPGAFDIAFAFDNWSEFAWIRYAALHVIGVLFTIHMVQLARVFLVSRASPTPWLWRPFARLWSARRGIATEPVGDP